MCNLNDDECLHAAQAERELIIDLLRENWETDNELVRLGNVIELIESLDN
jgi:hypothetical protein